MHTILKSWMNQLRYLELAQWNCLFWILESKFHLKCWIIE